MANRWVWSPDHISSNADVAREFGQADNAVLPETSNNRYGTRNLRFRGGIGQVGACTKYLYADYSELYFGAAAWWGDTATRTNFQFLENATGHVWVRRNGTTGLLEAGTGVSGLVATGSTPIPLSEWHFIEVYVKIADSGGRIIVKLDQRNSSVDYEIDYTGDTKNGGTGVINRLYFDGDNGTAHLRLTDFYVNDTTGTINNSWMGDMTVATLYPNGAGSSTQLNPSAGANWQNVDDAATDGDTSYNYSSAVGVKDLYGLSDTGPEVSAVFALSVLAVARKDTAGARTARTLIKSGAVEVEGGDITLLDAYATSATSHDLDPDGDVEWTKAALDALEAGILVEA
jgi:hypothetical protein